VSIDISNVKIKGKRKKWLGKNFKNLFYIADDYQLKYKWTKLSILNSALFDIIKAALDWVHSGLSIQSRLDNLACFLAVRALVEFVKEDKVADGRYFHGCPL
jgi:hypothetical protein